MQFRDCMASPKPGGTARCRHLLAALEDWTRPSQDGRRQHFACPCPFVSSWWRDVLCGRRNGRSDSPCVQRGRGAVRRCRIAPAFPAHHRQRSRAGVRADHRGVAAGAPSSENGGQGCPPETTAAAERRAAVSAAVWHQSVPVEVQFICYDVHVNQINALRFAKRRGIKWDSLLFAQVLGLCCLA